MIFSVDQTINLIATLRYPLLLPAVVIEGPIATIIAGFLSAHGYLSFTVSYLVVVIGDTTSDIGYYLLGRFGHAGMAKRLEAWLGITPTRIANLAEHFQKHGWSTFLAGKLLHGPGVAVLIAAGAAHVPWQKFVSTNFAITLIKSLVLLLIGFYFGQALRLFKNYFDVSALIAGGIVCIIIAVWLLKKRHVPLV